MFITSKKPDIEPDRILPLALASDLKDGRVQWSGHCLVNPWNAHGLVDLDGYLRFQAQYLRRIRVPDPKSIPPKLAETLRHAFETQDFELATKAALRAYQIDKIPKWAGSPPAHSAIDKPP